MYVMHLQELLLCMLRVTLLKRAVLKYYRNVGTYINNRVCFPTVVGNARTDEAYAVFEENNQLAVSPLAPIANLYSNIPVDYQHNVCLHMVRCLFHFYFGMYSKIFSSTMQINKIKIKRIV